jgi:hypothetical protein
MDYVRWRIIMLFPFPNSSLLFLEGEQRAERKRGIGSKQGLKVPTEE